MNASISSSAALRKNKTRQNKPVVATADNAASSLRSGRRFPAVPHFKRWAKIIMRHALVVLLAFIFVAGCNRGSTSTSVVRSFGSWASPDGSKKLEVTRREKSLVDFEVLDAASSNRLAGDHIGSDAMRWFFCWESSTRLWGYGSDIGYFKLFEFKSDGTVSETTVGPSMAVPPNVWENLPQSLQKKQKAQQAGASDGDKPPN